MVVHTIVEEQDSENKSDTARCVNKSYYMYVVKAYLLENIEV